MRSSFVDLLPGVWWKPANLYLGGRLHFCIGAGRPETRTVRTIEWNGHEILQGVQDATRLLERRNGEST